MADIKVFRLSEIGKSLQNMIEKHYQSGFWIKAEISKLNYYPKTGHCFPDLVERKNGKIKAQMRSIIWSTHYQKINKQFIEIAKTPLEDGMNILFRGKLSYHQTYGFSIQILRIDPEFTLGELAVEKEKCIKQLQQENLFHHNKRFATPLLVKRLAIISYNTSKGYADFLNIIQQYKSKFNLNYQLFPSLLQGDQAEKQLIEQLQNIQSREKAFDAVCIIRGGGGEVGMNCYNSYDVAKTLANMSLPVYTGIGHSTNETVCELIAFKNCITPTDLAYEIIEKFKDYDLRIKTATQNLLQSSRSIFVDDASYLKSLSKNIQKKVHNLIRFQNKNLEDVSLKHTSASRRILQQKKNQLQQIKYRIKKQPLSSLLAEQQNMAHQQRLLQIFSNRLLKTKQHKLESQEQRIKYLSPEHILQRGYSLILKEGKILSNPNELKKGDQIENLTRHGKITSEVLKINETKKNEV